MHRRHMIAGIALSLLLTASSANAGMGHQGINFQGINFQGLNFQGINFQGINFQGIDPNGINFQGINFQGINFQGVSFDGSELVMSQVGWEGSEYHYRHRTLDSWVHWMWDGSKVHVLDSGNTTLAQVGTTFDVQIYTDSRIPVTYTARIAGAKWLDTTNSMTYFADGAYSDNGDVAVYDIEILIPNGRRTIAVGLCDHSTGYGMFVKGRWGIDGAYSPDGMSFACDGPDGGVIAKCISQWGYKPWKSLPIDDGSNTMQNLGVLHRSCVRAARADYCGNGTSFTKNGTPVDIFDTFGFNVWAFYSEIQAFETEFCVDLNLEWESIFDEDGTAFHHTERYSQAQIPMMCDGSIVPPSEEGTELDLMGFFSDNVYGAPYIAVRSDPVVTWEIGPPVGGDIELLDGPIFEDQCP